MFGCYQVAHIVVAQCQQFSHKFRPAGFQTSKNDVIRVVHVGEATLDKRVSEFSKTDASDLTALEFEEHSKQVPLGFPALTRIPQTTCRELA